MESGSVRLFCDRRELSLKVGRALAVWLMTQQLRCDNNEADDATRVQWRIAFTVVLPILSPPPKHCNSTSYLGWLGSGAAYDVNCLGVLGLFPFSCNPWRLRLGIRAGYMPLYNELTKQKQRSAGHVHITRGSGKGSVH